MKKLVLLSQLQLLDDDHVYLTIAFTLDWVDRAYGGRRNRGRLPPRPQTAVRPVNAGITLKIKWREWTQAHNISPLSFRANRKTRHGETLTLTFFQLFAMRLSVDSAVAYNFFSAFRYTAKCWFRCCVYWTLTFFQHTPDFEIFRTFLF